MVIEYTFFILNKRLFFVRNWVLLYMNENAKRSAGSILMLYIRICSLSSVISCYIWCMLNKFLKYNKYRKIPKISTGAYIFRRPFWGAYFRRGLSTEGNLRYKIDWASLIDGRKFTVFALFYFVFEGNFQVQAPPPPRGGAYICRGDLTVGLSALRVWGTYIWKGLIFGILRYQLTKCWLKGKLEGLSEFPKNMCLIE